MSNTKLQDLGFKVGQAAVECANMAAHFCFTRLDQEALYPTLVDKAMVYIDAVQELEAFQLDEEEAQSQVVSDPGRSDQLSQDTSVEESGRAREQLLLPLV